MFLVTYFFLELQQAEARDYEALQAVGSLQYTKMLYWRKWRGSN